MSPHVSPSLTPHSAVHPSTPPLADRLVRAPVFGDRAPRALVVSGSYGAGHDSAAHQIQVRLTASGWRTDVIDIADLFPLGLGHVLKYAYFKQLELSPRTWRAVLHRLESDPEPAPAGAPTRTPAGRRASRISGRLPARRLAAAVHPATGLIVSTHPFASQALGHLREAGLLDLPVTTYLTDASVHPLWVHPAVDVHLAIHHEAARQARSRGATDVRLIQPLTPHVPPATGRERAELRAHLGLPGDQPVALISGGSQGAGEVRLAARDVRDTGAATPVVICGHNERLRRSLEREPGLHALGWIDGLTAAIRGSDCVIQNSGGFTTLEALALGTPLISYRCLPGHGEASADALRIEGLAPWPQTRSELGAAIDHATINGPVRPPYGWRLRQDLLNALPLPAATEMVG